MNISNSYINLLRYVSAQGKKCSLETIQNSIKKGEKLIYTGPTEYKSTPISMPLKKTGISYSWWKDIILNKGGSKSEALDGWFKIITPPTKRKLNRLEQEIIKCYSKENIEKIEFFKTLSDKEKNYLVQYGEELQHVAESFPISTDDVQLFAVLTGKKPAWFCEHGFNRKVDFNKIKLNPKVAEKFDVIKMPRGQLFFVNKKEVLKIIRENKDLYYTALYAKPDESLETVYKKLLQNLQYGLTGHALFGMTLGFPRHSSMIFELEGLIKKQNTDLREDIPLFKEELLKLLASDKSPFKRYSQTTIKYLEEHIKSMKATQGISTPIYYFQAHGNEEKTLSRILKQAKDFEDNFRVEDLM